MINLNIQIGGSHNSQTIQQTSDSIGRLLNDAERHICDTRTFVSEEVKTEYLNKLSELNAWLFQNRQHTFDATRFILFPFKTLPEQETLRDAYFLGAILDTLTMVAFSDLSCEIIHQHLNTCIEGKPLYGIYYQVGLTKLISAFQRLIKCFHAKNIPLPYGFIFIILNCIDEPIELEKIKNIVPDIMGDSAFIKPLATGTPKCISLSSYVIENCQSVTEARDYVRELLSYA